MALPYYNEFGKSPQKCGHIVEHLLFFGSNWYVGFISTMLVNVNGL